MIRPSAGRRRRRAVLAAVMITAAALTGSAGSAPAPIGLAGPSAIEAPPARVGGDVLRALETRDEVPVLVTMRQAAAAAGGRHISRRDVAAARGRVLEAVGDEVALGMAYAFVPAFSALVTHKGLEQLRSAPDVLAVDLPGKRQRALAEGVSLIRADQAHAQGVTGAGVTVAVIDTGIDAAHPDLADDIVAEACFVRRADGTGACPNGARRHIGPGSAPDKDGHGTAVAGIVTSRGAVAPRGVAPDAKIVGIKVFPDEPGAEADARDTLAALDWILVARPDVRIVNLSLGSPPVTAPCDTGDASVVAEASAVSALRARGVTVVAASGNDGSTTGLSAPACVSGAISVGAVYDADLGSYATQTCTDPSTGADKVACYSNGGKGLDVLAPGPGTVAPAPGGGTVDFGGTSAAAPFVAGVAALLLQARPGLGPDGVVNALRASGVPVRDERTSRTTPRVDAAAALALLPTLADALPRQALPAAAAAYADSRGDAGAGADVSDIRVSTSGDGLLTFAASAPNRNTLSATDQLQIMVDTDNNPATGSRTGAEYAVVVHPDADAELLRWARAAWELHGLVDNASFTGGALTVTLDETSIGAPRDFDFVLASFVSRTVADVAPGAGAWPYPAQALRVGRSGTGSGTVSGGGALGVDCGVRCTTALAPGAAVTLSAAPVAGSVFLGWSGACSGTDACALSMDAPKDVTARFEALRRLTVSRAGTGVGAVTSAPGAISCGAACAAEFPHGVSLSLAATAQPGSRFEGWSGACSGTAECGLALAGATSVTATFRDVQAPRAVALSSSTRSGGRAALQYRLDDNSGQALARISIYASGRRLAQLRRPLARATGGVTSQRWRVPRSAGRRPLRFCVLPVDAGGNRGALTCARLAVR